MHSSSYGRRDVPDLSCPSISIFSCRKHPPGNISAGEDLFNVLKPFLTFPIQQAMNWLWFLSLSPKNTRTVKIKRMKWSPKDKAGDPVRSVYTSAPSPDDKPVFDRKFEQFNELLDKYFTEHRSVTFYADAIKVHPYHLNFLSKKVDRAVRKGSHQQPRHAGSKISSYFLHPYD